MQTDDVKNLYKAINNLHGVLNDQSQRIDNFLNDRCDDNKTDIDQNSDALIEVSESADTRIAELDDAVIEVSEDADVRITELEDAVIELANQLAEAE